MTTNQTTPELLVGEVRRALAAMADPERGAAQQDYMKSTMPFYGIVMPQLRATVKALYAAETLADEEAWRAAVRLMWDDATHREERYAALSLLRHRRYRSFAGKASPENLELLRHLVVTGGWWDLVDELSHVVGDLLAANREEMTPVVRAWAADADLWLRRAAIICQLGARGRTDVDLLTFAIGESMDDEDFFARKAIGWALREYSKTDEAWVRAYVAEHADRLSPLSVREALKWAEQT